MGSNIEAVPYASGSPLRGDDLLDSVLEDIRLICKKYGVAIIAHRCAEIVTAVDPICPGLVGASVKLGELLYAHEGRIGYTRTAYRRTTHQDPQATAIQIQKGDPK